MSDANQDLKIGLKEAPEPLISRTPAQFPTAESSAAGRIGIGRDHIRALRQQFLTKDVHWTLWKNRVFLSDEAIQLLAHQKNLPIPSTDLGRPGHDSDLDAPAPLPTEKTRPGPITAANRLLPPASRVSGELCFLFAWHRPINTNILEARLNAADQSREGVVRVRVRSNENFMRGQELLARWIDADLYELVGHCPRHRGENLTAHYRRAMEKTTDEELRQFLQQLDEAPFEVTDWEARFLGDMLSQIGDYSPGQRDKIFELRRRYESRMK